LATICCHNCLPLTNKNTTLSSLSENWGSFQTKAAVSHLKHRDRVFPAQTEPVEFDFTKPETFYPALQGVRRLFLVRPPAISQVKQFIYPFIDVARKTGVEHIVFLSILGAESLSVTPHAKIEQYIQLVGIPYTFLRRVRPKSDVFLN
jgi:uncharacterized protein YbjT (DUF2867 family)